MRKSISSLAALISIRAAGFMATAASLADVASVKTSGGIRKSQQYKNYRAPGKRYPEQSTRQ